MKLTTLKPRLQTLATAVPTLRVNPRATPRMRGQRGVDRRARWLAQHPFCVHCEQEGRQFSAAHEVDHRVPLEQGGADDPSNFQSLCTPHHRAKTALEARQRAGKC